MLLFRNICECSCVTSSSLISSKLDLVRLSWGNSWLADKSLCYAHVWVDRGWSIFISVVVIKCTDKRKLWGQEVYLAYNSRSHTIVFSFLDIKPELHSYSSCRHGPSKENYSGIPCLQLAFCTLIQLKALCLGSDTLMDLGVLQTFPSLTINTL